MKTRSRSNNRLKINTVDVRSSYSEEKASSDKMNHPWIYHVLRPISFHLTPIFIKHNVSANSVTLFGTIIIVASILLNVCTKSDGLFFLISGLLMNIWLLLDTVDGNIARFNNSSSKFGELIDWFSGMIASAIFPISVGIGLFLFDSTENLILGNYLSELQIIIYSLVYSFSAIFTSLTSLRAKKTFESANHNYYKKDLAVNKAILFSKAILSFNLPLFLLSTLTNSIMLWLIFYAFINFLNFIGIIIFSFIKAYKLDKHRIL